MMNAFVFKKITILHGCFFFFFEVLSIYLLAKNRQDDNALEKFLTELNVDQNEKLNLI